MSGLSKSNQQLLRTEVVLVTYNGDKKSLFLSVGSMWVRELCGLGSAGAGDTSFFAEYIDAF